MSNSIPYSVLIAEAEASYLKKDYTHAKTKLLNIIELKPRDTKANELLGLIYVDENRASDALESLKIAVEDKHCSSISLYKLASIYTQNENYHLAIKHLERLFEKELHSLEIALEIASIYVITEQYG